MNKLNLGSGLDYKEGWVNVDIDPDVKTDWCGDACILAEIFYPHSNGTVTHLTNYFNHIYAHHSLEHFHDLFVIVDEMARISKDGATWEIITPYCTWVPGWGNPHHHILFHENTFRFFDKGENGIHKRREQDYSIETVKVEYGWNLDAKLFPLDEHRLRRVESEWIQLKDKYLNVVTQITFHLKVHK